MFKFLKEAKRELKKVVWPNKRQTIKYTLTVIVISLVAAIFLGLIDYIMTIGVEKLLS